MPSDEPPAKRRPFCLTCTKPLRLCLCSRLRSPPIHNLVGVTVLQHVRERTHPLNSVRIASLGLRNLDVVCVSDVVCSAELVVRPLDGERLGFGGKIRSFGGECRFGDRNGGSVSESSNFGKIGFFGERCGFEGHCVKGGSVSESSGFDGENECLEEKYERNVELGFGKFGSFVGKSDTNGNGGESWSTDSISNGGLVSERIDFDVLGSLEDGGSYGNGCLKERFEGNEQLRIERFAPFVGNSDAYGNCERLGRKDSCLNGDLVLKEFEFDGVGNGGCGEDGCLREKFEKNLDNEQMSTAKVSDFVQRADVSVVGNGVNPRFQDLNHPHTSAALVLKRSDFDGSGGVQNCDFGGNDSLEEKFEENSSSVRLDSNEVARNGVGNDEKYGLKNLQKCLEELKLCNANGVVHSPLYQIHQQKLKVKPKSIFSCQKNPSNGLIAPDAKDQFQSNDGKCVVTYNSDNLLISVESAAKPDIGLVLTSPIGKAIALNGFTVKKIQRKKIRGTSHFEDFEEFNITIPPGTALLYPCKRSIDLDKVDFEIKHLVVLDGTWGKARRMYHENPWLKFLPHLRLDTENASLYSEVRHQPKVGCLSTVESVVCALKGLGCGDVEGLDNMLNLFESMIADQRRCKDEKFSQTSSS